MGETREYFGPICIDFKMGLKKVKAKYNSFHREITNEFGVIVKREIGIINGKISAEQAKIKMIDFQNSKNIIDSISLLTRCEQPIKDWKVSIEELSTAEGILVD